MPKLVTLSHEFLRSFCRNNKENQFRLHKYISTEHDAKEGCLRVNTVINYSFMKKFLKKLQVSGIRNCVRKYVLL